MSWEGRSFHGPSWAASDRPEDDGHAAVAQAERGAYIKSRGVRGCTGKKVSRTLTVAYTPAGYVCVTVRRGPASSILSGGRYSCEENVRTGAVVAKVAHKGRA